MNQLDTILAVLAGIAVGFLHATTLWHAVHRVSVWSTLIGGLRIALVGLLFVVAAIHGQIVAIAIAWALSFGISVAACFYRGEKHSSLARRCGPTKQGNPRNAT